MIIVVYEGHVGFSHPVEVLFFANSVFGRGEALSSQIKEPQKKTWGTSIVPRVKGAQFMLPLEGGWFSFYYPPADGGK